MNLGKINLKKKKKLSTIPSYMTSYHSSIDVFTVNTQENSLFYVENFPLKHAIDIYDSERAVMSFIRRYIHAPGSH